MRPSHPYLAVVIPGLAVAAFACGGTGVEGPEVPAPSAAHCDDGDGALSTLRESWREGALREVGESLVAPLIEEGALRVFLPVMLESAETLPDGTREAMLDAVGHQGDFETLAPHAARTLEYLVGESALIEGEHFEPLDTIQRMASGFGARCRPQTLLSTLGDLLVVDIEHEGQERRFVDVYLDAWAELARDPGFRAFLDRVEFNDEDRAGTIYVGRDAFVVAARLLLKSAAEPDLEIETLKARVDELVLLQVLDGAEATRARIYLVLELYDALRQKRPELFVELQDLVSCGVDADQQGALLGMLYDYLSIETLDFADLLEDVVIARDSPTGQLAFNLFVEITTRLRGQPSRGRDMVHLVETALAPERTRAYLPAILRARGTGVRAHAVEVVRTLWEGCEPTRGGDEVQP